MNTPEYPASRLWLCFAFLTAFISGGHTGFSQTFYKLLGAVAVNEGGEVIEALPDGNFIIGGFKADSALIMKADPAGNILWSRVFKPQTGSLDNIVHDLRVTPDNFIIGAGYSSNFAFEHHPFYFKLDLNGNFQWIHRITDMQSTYFKRILYKSPTEYTIYGSFVASTSSIDGYCIRVNSATGAFISNSSRIANNAPNSFLNDQLSSTMGRGEASYSTGRSYVGDNATTRMRPYLIKYDALGNHVFSRYLMHTATQTARLYGTDIIYTNDSLVFTFYGDALSNSNNFTAGLLKTDTLGNVAWNKNYQVTGSSTEYAGTVLKTPGGYLLSGFVTAPSGDLNFCLLSTDNNGNLLWAKSYGGTGTESWKVVHTRSVAVKNGFIYLTGYSLTGATSDLVLAKVDLSNGNISCMPPTTLTVTISTNPTNTTLDNVNRPAFSLSTASSAAVSFIALNDQCPEPDLGTDTSVCFPFLLNATTAGATQYLWSDGSVSPALNVTQPGTYWVTVTAGCCLVTDTIVISSVNTVQTAIAASTPVCNQHYSFSLSPPVTVISSQWDFGDGGSSTSLSPSHTYATAGTYTVSVTLNTTCGNATIDTVITVQPSLTHSAFSAMELPCLDNSVIVTNESGVAPSLCEWQFGDGNTAAGNNMQYTYAAPGTYTVLLITDPNTPCADTASQAVTADTTHPQFTASLVGCSYEVNFTGITTPGYAFLWLFGDGMDDQFTQNPTHTYAGPGTYTVCLSEGNICPDSTFHVITIPDITSTASFSFPVSLCADSTVFTNTSVDAQDYLWNFGDGSAASTAVSPVHYYTAGTYTVQLIAYNTVCSTTDTVFQTITVHPLPELDADSVTICTGQQAVLNASGALSYSWSNSQSGTPITVSPLVTTAYTVTGTDANSCSASVVSLVTVNPLPVVTVNSESICTGGSIILTANSSAPDYTWSTGETVNTVTVSPVSTTSYTVTSVDANGCSASATSSVTVNSLPVVVVNSPTICAGSSAVLLAEGASTYSWSTSETGSSITVSPPSDISYTLTGTDNNGCSSSTVALVTVLPVPFASLINDTVLCSSASLIVNIVSGGNSVLWNTGATANSITVTQPGDYWVELSNGFCSDRDTVIVQFFTSPALGTDVTQCDGTTLTLSANAPGAVYQWSNGSSAASITVGTSGIYWLEASMGSCYARDSVIVKFIPVPDVNLGSDTALCDQQLQDSLLLDAGFMSSATYLWSTDDTTQSINVSSAGAYWVIVSNAMCSDTDTIMVSRFEGIELGGKRLICAQEPIELVPVLARNVTTTYLWSTGETTPAITVGGPDVYVLQATQATCVYTDSVEVLGSISEGALYVPNAFTPGPDFKNDIFYAVGEAISKFEMRIFNRWGEQIFESHDQSEGWDGTYKGKPVPSDTYIWIIDYITDCSQEMSIRKSGTVTLIR